LPNLASYCLAGDCSDAGTSLSRVAERTDTAAALHLRRDRVYLVGAASHLLTVPDVLGHAGLWPFVIVQGVLIWIWFVLHAQRLHDAGRGSGLAVGVALLYILSIRCC